MFVDRTLETSLSAGVLAGTQPGVAAYLLAIFEAVPVANLSLHLLKDHRCHPVGHRWGVHLFHPLLHRRDLLIDGHDDRSQGCQQIQQMLTQVLRVREGESTFIFHIPPAPIAASRSPGLFLPFPYRLIEVGLFGTVHFKSEGLYRLNNHWISVLKRWFKPPI